MFTIIDMEEQEVVVEETRQEVAVEEKAPTKRELRKEKRHARIKNRLFKETDIKYRGPLSYRALRIIAWVAFALSQFLLFYSFPVKFGIWQPLNSFWSTVLSFFSSLSTPFFIIASFGVVLSGQRKFKDLILVYGSAYLGLGLGIVFFYYRYVNGLFVKLGLDETSAYEAINLFLDNKVQVNVFADLFAFVMFHFFINYTPRHLKIFTGKKVIIFRLLTLLPVAFVITSYILRIFSAFDTVNYQFFVYPFLTTKSPIIFAVFAVGSLWIKNRERWFLKLGSTKKEYNEFTKTNRNSLSFSIHLSVVIAIGVVVDLLNYLLLILFCVIFTDYTNAEINVLADKASVGQALPLLLAIPFILLYSYTRAHKNNTIDIIIPVIGIGLTAFVYIESIYQVINTLAK